MVTAHTSEPPATPWYRKPRGILLLHAGRCILSAYLIGPIAAFACHGLESSALGLPAAFVVGLAFGALCVIGKQLPPSLTGRYLMPLLLCWTVIPFAFFYIIIAFAFSGIALSPIRFIPGMYIIGLVIGFVIHEQRRKDKLRLTPTAWSVLCFLLLIPAGWIAFAAYDDYLYSKKRGHGFERVGGFSDTDLKPYDPRVPEAVTPRLAGPASFTIPGTKDLPVLDGAQAAFPVYAAFAGACYPDLPPLTKEQQERYDYLQTNAGTLTFTNTLHAFDRLVQGNVDIFFGAQPSARQLEKAAAAGKELVLTPIGKDAFVFFVNEANPVNNLSTRQIQDIYSGKLRNWKEAGGADAPVIAFQRPVDSGSHTIMVRFMGDVALEPALRNRYAAGMGGIAERVAEYRNAPSAIGYSFRFFLTGMGKQPRIKILSIDGIAPDAQTIPGGAYPYVAELYAVTLKDNPNPHIAPFLQWMQGPQGQELVERTGYTRYF